MNQLAELKPHDDGYKVVYEGGKCLSTNGDFLSVETCTGSDN